MVQLKIYSIIIFFQSGKFLKYIVKNLDSAAEFMMSEKTLPRQVKAGR